VRASDEVANLHSRVSDGFAWLRMWGRAGAERRTQDESRSTACGESCARSVALWCPADLVRGWVRAGHGRDPDERPRAEAFEHVWKRIKSELGHLYVVEVDASALDAFKQKLPKHLGPNSVNQHLILIRAAPTSMEARQAEELA
jgi:hypothetical protein